MKLKGYLLAALAAAAYGTNPVFAIPLYEQGMSVNSVLFFRYLLGIPLLAALVLYRGHSLHLSRGQIGPVAILGILMALSSLTLFASYNYINAGVASTLLFVYPILVAVLMIFFFHERFRISVAICLLVMSAGLSLLMKNSSGELLDPYGCLLVMMSALTYSLYIIMVNVSENIRGIVTSKLLFYVLVWGTLLFIGFIAAGNTLTVPSKPSGWLNLAALAVIPTVLSLVCTTRAIQIIGPTPTAILGSLEPVSAVVLSVIVLHQGITVREIVGGVLIVLATMLVVGDTTVENLMLHVRRMFPRGNRLRHKR